MLVRGKQYVGTFSLFIVSPFNVVEIIHAKITFNSFVMLNVHGEVKQRQTCWRRYISTCVRVLNRIIFILWLRTIIFTGSKFRAYQIFSIDMQSVCVYRSISSFSLFLFRNFITRHKRVWRKRPKIFFLFHTAWINNHRNLCKFCFAQKSFREFFLQIGLVRLRRIFSVMLSSVLELIVYSLKKRENTFLIYFHIF